MTGVFEERATHRTIAGASHQFNFLSTCELAQADACFTGSSPLSLLPFHLFASDGVAGTREARCSGDGGPAATTKSTVCLERQSDWTVNVNTAK